MLFSIIIPTLNEEKYLGNLLSFLREQTIYVHTEIIIVDGGGSDHTISIAQQYNVTVLKTDVACRAIQMNFGAKYAIGKILYFVHADVIPPSGFTQDIIKVFTNGKKFGMFRQKFEGGPVLLKVNSFFTRFNWLWCRGGDQTMFVRKDHFNALNGFDETFVIMEEYEFIRRSMEIEKLHVFKKYTTVSTRKYNTNSYLKVLLANRKAFALFQSGADPLKIKNTYSSMLNPY